MPVYNLPPVGERLIKARDIGAWVSIPSLDALARALRLDDQQVRPEDLKSIPDAWAQVQLTADALFDQSHDAHAEVLSQWRGILALFALQPTYAAEYTIAVHSVPIAAASQGRVSRLRQVLAALAPTSAVSSSVDWSQIGIVDIVDPAGDGLRSAAMLSPITLVAPGRMASSLRLAVPWAANGIADPLAGEELPPHAWRILTAFLDGLLGRFRNLSDRSETVDVREQLIRQLELYRIECAKHTADSIGVAAKVLHEDWPQPFFAMLGQTFVAESGGAMETLIRLAGPGAGELFEGVILIDPTLSETLAKPATNIVVWGEHTLAQALKPATLQKIRAEAEKDGYLVLGPDDFFTQKLVKLSSLAEIAAHPRGLKDHLLPLSPASLLFFEDVADLAENVGLRDRGHGTEVTLSLPLMSPDGEDRRHTIRKVYPRADVIEMPPPDDLALWPNFESEDWPWTYLRFQYRPRSELQTRFAASSQFITADLVAQDRRGRLNRFAEWSSSTRLAVDARARPGRLSTVRDANGKTLLSRVRFAELPDLVGEHHRLSTPVSAICFAVRQGDKGPDLPVGLALVKRAENRPGVGSATVSIDFGTTNTIAYVKGDGGGLERLVIKDRIYFPIQYSRDETRLASAYTDFFCLQDHATPVPTVAKRRAPTGAPLGKDLIKCVEEGSSEVGVIYHIFFMPALQSDIDALGLLGLITKGELLFDLKWGGDPKNRKVVQVFLEQLMILAGAELAERGVPLRRVSWRFSHPQAFTPGQLANFQTIIKASQTALLAEAGEGRQDASLSLMTEGEAAAAYFFADPEQGLEGLSRLFVTLDIGGGTTDLAVRLDDNLVWRGSIRLAGSHFFRNYLVKNPEVLKIIEPSAVQQLEEAAAADAKMGLHENSLAEQVVDLIIAKPGFAEAFARAYPVYESSPAWAGLRHCAMTAVAGMLHYVGLVLRLLVSAEMFSEKELEGQISVAFGGLGSSFYRLLHTGPEPTPLANLSKVAASAAGTNPATARFQPRFSRGPKEEVARGLLLNRPPAARGRGVSLVRPNGLDVDVPKMGGSLTVRWDDNVNDLLQFTEAASVSIDQLLLFLRQLRAQTGLDVLLTRDGESAIALKTRQFLSQELKGLTVEERLEADLQTVEAPFVTALRLLVGMLAERESVRHNLVSVKEKP